MATAYSSTGTCGGKSSRQWRIVLTYSTSTSATAVTVSWTATIQMKSAAQYGVYLECGDESTTGYITSSSSSWKDVCSVSGSTSYSRTTSAQTKTLTAYGEGQTVSGYGAADGSLSVSASISVPALDSYVVSYDANGGSGAPSSQTKYYGKSLTLSSATPSRENYNFLGWNTEADGSGTSYAPGSTYTGNAALTLYAQWEVAYTPPMCSEILIGRCDADGNADDYGTYALVHFVWMVDIGYSDNEIASIVIDYTAGTKTASASGYIGRCKEVVGGSLDPDTSYPVKVTLTDTVGGADYATTYTGVIPKVSFPIDFKSDGKGVAVLMPSSEDGFHVGGPMVAHGTIEAKNGLVGDAERPQYNGVDLALASDVTGDTTAYLPLSGGTMQGPIKFSSASLPSKTLQYVTGVDALVSGGEMGYQSKADFLSGYATTAQLAGYAPTSHSHSDHAKLQAMNDMIHDDNEFTIVPDAFSGALYWNYRTASGNTNGNISNYLFCNGKGGTSGVTLSADAFSGTAAKATADGNGNNIANTYLPKSGGTLTGNLYGKYLVGTWLQTTSVTDLGSTPSKIAVIDGNGWIYYRTPAEILSDIGAAAAGHTHSYLPLSGGTLTGALNLANGTWNLAGDDAYFGDNNTAGSFAIKGANGTTNLKMVARNGTAYGTLSWDGSKFAFSSPSDTSGSETSSVKLLTSNGGSITFGKEGPNSGTMIRLDQVDGTARLRFRASSAAGAMVWEQPEQGAQLYVDLGATGVDKHRITFPSSAGTLALTSQIPSLSGYATTAQLANYSTTDHTHSDYASKSTANTYNGEQRFQNSSYCPTVTDTASGVGCAFKASRGMVNELLADKMIMTATTGKIPFYKYTATGSGQMTDLAEVAYIDGNGVTTGGSSYSTWTGMQAVRLCANDSDNVNTAGFIINKDGTSKFLHRRGDATASEDAYFLFDGLGYSMYASGTKGTAPGTTPTFAALQNATRPTFKGSDLALFDDVLSASLGGVILEDYVVAQGTSGIWEYRKWKSGVAECWGRNETTITFESGWSGLPYDFSMPFSNISVTLPFTFTAAPVVSLTYGTGYLFSMIVSSSTNAVFFRPGSAYTGHAGADVAVSANLYVVGRWQ